MKTKFYLLPVFFCLTAGAFGFEAPKPPNIILVMADDQGWGDMAYNGHPQIKTPNFDAMAGEGLRLNRFYAAAPVCSPTRASVLTGRHPNRLGVFKWGWPIRPQEQTIAELLKTSGYATGHFGKWHLGSVRNNSPAHPGNNGFDEWISAPNFYENNAILSKQGKATRYRGESSMFTMDLALQWMSKQNAAGRPFLAVIWFGSPHAPHVGGKKELEMYPTIADKRKKNFLAEVSGMDLAIGKLRKTLRDWKIHENTLLWYTSDNGALPRVGSTGGFRGHKGKVYEGGLLVPSIIEWPAKIKKPHISKVRCNSCDILPTVLAAIEFKKKLAHPIDGVDLMPLIKGKSFSRSKPMGFWDYKTRGKSTPSAKLMKALLDAQNQGKDLKPDQVSLDAEKLPKVPFGKTEFPGHAAWIDGDLKLHRIQNAKKGEPKFELYDLSKDPFEKKNLIGERTDDAKRLKKGLQNWLEGVVDSYNGKDYRK